MAAVALLAGCVDFEGQSLTYRHDEENDRLLVFQVYENIHSTKTTADTSADFEILESAIRARQTFFFDNWLFEYNREEWQEDLSKLRERLKTAEDEEAGELRYEIDLQQLVIDSVCVRNGSFFLNEQGQLCAYQGVTVSNIAEIVQQVNEMGSLAVLAELPGMTNGYSAADREVIRKFAARREWLVVKGHEIRIRFPGTREEYDEFVEDLDIAQLSANYSRPFINFTLGREQESACTLRRPPSDQVRSNLIEQVRAAYGIPDSVDIDQIRRDFMKTGNLPESSS